MSDIPSIIELRTVRKKTEFGMARGKVGILYEGPTRDLRRTYEGPFFLVPSTGVYSFSVSVLTRLGNHFATRLGVTCCI